MYYAIKYKQFQASSPIFHDGVRDEMSERSEVSTGFSNVKKLKNTNTDTVHFPKVLLQEDGPFHSPIVKRWSMENITLAEAAVKEKESGPIFTSLGDGTSRITYCLKLAEGAGTDWNECEDPYATIDFKY
uniref:Uncharacterized protein n=1 Tax=Caenorhabditis japonica TaxID=281687 RepID=A0A8R1EIW0_CAEJA